MGSSSRHKSQKYLCNVGRGMRSSPVFRPDLQFLHIRRLFPNARLCRSDGNVITFTVVTKIGNSYRAQVEISTSNSVRVCIRDHDFPEGTPHLYPDGSLCLYHPSQYRWKCSELLVHSIIPLTCLWLHCYDIWVATGVWFGDEYPHQATKFA